MNLLQQTQITRVLNAATADVTTLNCTVVDMLHWDGVVFVVAVGALTAGQVTKIKAQQGTLEDGSDMQDLAGSSVGPLADTDSNKLLLLELQQVTKRYVRCVVIRGTANAVIDSVVAIQHTLLSTPSFQGSTVATSKVDVAPKEGTP